MESCENTFYKIVVLFDLMINVLVSNVDRYIHIQRRKRRFKVLSSKWCIESENIVSLSMAFAFGADSFVRLVGPYSPQGFLLSLTSFFLVFQFIQSENDRWKRYVPIDSLNGKSAGNSPGLISLSIVASIFIHCGTQYYRFYILLFSLSRKTNGYSAVLHHRLQNIHIAMGRIKHSDANDDDDGGKHNS